MSLQSKFLTGAGLGLVLAVTSLPSQGLAQNSELAVGRTYSGELTNSDSSGADKQVYDNWNLRGRAGERLSIVMESDDFDAQLRVALPDGVIVNDDNHWIAETTDSRIDFVMPASGSVSARASAFRPGQLGEYSIRLVPTETLASGGEDSAPPEAVRIGQTLSGELTREDTEIAGRRTDRFVFTGSEGQRIDLRAASTDFDTMLTLQGPGNTLVRNDDDGTAEQQTLNSRLLATLPAAGQYTVSVTSYGRGSTGAYQLTTALNRSGIADTEAAGGNAMALSIGRSFSGVLGKDDETLSSGEYLQRFTFEGRRGQPVTIDYNSEDFDTYLIVRSPSGEQRDIDDTGESLNSRFEDVLAEDGLYTVLATSYAPGATGAYNLSIEEGTSRIPANPQQRRVFAVSVGVSDYGGNANDLANTDTDASKIYQKLRELGVLHEASILLTNQDATIDEFRRAFRQVASQAGPDDIFLLFFSGHGVQEEDPSDSAELDGRDELLVFGDGEELRDDELAQMFSQVNAGTSMVVLDACFSGGFERDVITRPNMMGLFSSEEDLTSLVASEFSAGGYLARFFSDAVGGRADDNADGNITAGELVSYLRYRFREQCDGRNCIEAETGDAQRNHQELVVQRGSVEVDDILVTLPEQFGLVGG